MAAALGTRHREVELGGEELRALWPAALAAMDQPSIDGFNTFLISRAAHEAGFKVVLSGLGGDELLGGYPSFNDVPRMVRVGARAAHAARAAGAVAAADGDMGRRKMVGLLRYGPSLPGAYLLRRGLFLPEELPALLGERGGSRGAAPLRPARRRRRCARRVAGALATTTDQTSSWLAVHRLETARYLRHQLLRDSDWASMAWSVELRVPLVDAVLHRHAQRVGFAPARQHGKVTAVRAAAPELPDELFGRKKTGFYVPLAEALAEDATALSHGERSRRLALQILAAHGVSLPWREAAADTERNSRDEALSLVG